MFLPTHICRDIKSYFFVHLAEAGKPMGKSTTYFFGGGGPAYNMWPFFLYCIRPFARKFRGRSSERIRFAVLSCYCFFPRIFPRTTYGPSNIRASGASWPARVNRRIAYRSAWVGATER